MLEWIRLADSLLSILTVFALIAGQAYLIKHQIQQLHEEIADLKRQMDNLRELLEQEREKRHEAEKKQAMVYVQRPELAYHISRLEAGWKELKDELKGTISEALKNELKLFVLEAFKHDRETG